MTLMIAKFAGLSEDNALFKAMNARFKCDLNGLEKQLTRFD